MIAQKEKMETIQPKANLKNLLSRFRQLGSSFVTVIAELLDNSIASAVPNSDISIHLVFKADWTYDKRLRRTVGDFSDGFFEIIDTSTGISLAKIEKALSFAEDPENANGLNQFGLGLKQAVAQFGDVVEITTRCQNEDGYRIKLDYSQPMQPQKCNCEIGTRIKISKFTDLVPRKKEYYIELEKELGAIYSKFISGYNREKKKAKIKITLLNLDGSTQWEQNVVSINPHYRNSEPIVDEEISGKNDGKHWAARIRFGFAPSESEIDSYVLDGNAEYDSRKRDTHPYFIRGKNISVVYRDKRFPKTKTLADISGKGGYDNVFGLYYTGEIILITGCDPDTTKSDVVESDEWKAICKEFWAKVQTAVTCEVAKLHSSKKKEEDIKTTLMEIFNNRGLTFEKEVCLDVGGRQDFVVGNPAKPLKETWEVKAEKGEFIHVLQAYGYAVFNNDPQVNRKKVVLTAPGFSCGAKALAKRIKERTGVEVELVKLQSLGLQLNDLDDVEVQTEKQHIL